MGGGFSMSVLPYIRVVTQVVRKLFPEFAYTTISTNRDFPGYLHIDGKNFELFQRAIGSMAHSDIVSGYY